LEKAARRARLASDLGTTEIDVLAINILGQKTFFNRTIGAALMVEIHGKQDQRDVVEGRDAKE
jgi:hypothetical protein